MDTDTETEPHPSARQVNANVALTSFSRLGVRLSMVGSSINPEVITYPEGCKEINEDMMVDELIRRLKTLASVFDSLEQVLDDENIYNKYVPLCLKLTEYGFLQHPSADVRLLVASCISDTLRIYAPNAPYHDPEHIKAIFKFLFDQLEGIKDPRNPAFKRTFRLLENLTMVKSFNVIFELKDSKELVCQLFEFFFRIINTNHSEKVKTIILDALSLFFDESTGDAISTDLLNIIFINFLEPHKSTNKSPYDLASRLILRCATTLQPFIEQFLIGILNSDSDDTYSSNNFIIHQKLYDLLFELHHINSQILLPIIPQLEHKLTSINVDDRLGAVSLFARIFSAEVAEDSNLTSLNPNVWKTFVGRFNDANVSVRIKCIQYSMHLLLNHSLLLMRGPDIIKVLKDRLLDSEESVRLQVVKTLVATSKFNNTILLENADLLSSMKERIIDKQFKIRREAMKGLALIYKHYSPPIVFSVPLDHGVTKISEKILHVYYMNSIEDRILVEQLLNTYLVPYELETKDRMCRLLYLYGTIDENASKAFIQIQKNLIQCRNDVGHFIELVKSFSCIPLDEFERRQANKISALTKYFPDSVKAMEFLHKFSIELKEDKTMLISSMESIVNPMTDCHGRVECMKLILKHLGPPLMTNLYYNTIKILLERTTSVLIDKDAVNELISMIYGLALNKPEGGQLLASLRLSKVDAMNSGLKLISVLTFVFPTLFSDNYTLKLLADLLKLVSKDFFPLLLRSMLHICKNRPLAQYHPNLMTSLAIKLQGWMLIGNLKQAKITIRFLHQNMEPAARDNLFTQHFFYIRDNLTTSNVNLRTCIVALGHMAELMPEKFGDEMKGIITQKIIKELLMNPCRTEEDKYKTGLGNWCLMENLPEVTKCMVAAMKTTVLWLIGLKSDMKSAVNTFKMLTAFIQSGGTFIKAKIPFSSAEISWLRLSAGCCMLKLCKRKGVGDQFTPEQFFELSELMTNDVLEVRSRFAAKVHKGLSQKTRDCLPMDFMGFYALGGLEQDEKQRRALKSYISSGIRFCRERAKELEMRNGSGVEKKSEPSSQILPDYMLIFAVPILTNHHSFTSHENIDELQHVANCLWFILEPLMEQSENYSFGFYKAIINAMKHHTNSTRPDNELVNNKMYAVCDLVLKIITNTSSDFQMKDFPFEPKIPPMYFKRSPFFNNTHSYLPPEMDFTSFTKAPARIAGTPGGSKKGKFKKQEIVQSRNIDIDVGPSDPSELSLEISGLMGQESEGEGSVTTVDQRVNVNLSRRKEMKTNAGRKLSNLLPTATATEATIESKKRKLSNTPQIKISEAVQSPSSTGSFYLLRTNKKSGIGSTNEQSSQNDYVTLLLPPELMDEHLHIDEIHGEAMAESQDCEADNDTEDNDTPPTLTREVFAGDEEEMFDILGSGNEIYGERTTKEEAQACTADNDIEDDEPPPTLTRERFTDDEEEVYEEVTPEPDSTTTSNVDSTMKGLSKKGKGPDRPRGGRNVR